MEAEEKLKAFIGAIGVVGEIEALLYNTLVGHDVPPADARIISVDTAIKILTVFGGIR